jgi:F0F1-type ATP synthase assembly protein I
VNGGDGSLPMLVVALQAASALVVALGLVLIDAAQAQAALLAGLVTVIPSGYFAWRAGAERSPGRLIGQGLMKFALTVALMALVFAVFEPAPEGFFAAFVLMQTMYAAGPLVSGGRTR